MQCSYLTKLTLYPDGSTVPHTVELEPTGWVGPEPVLQVMNDPTDQNFTFSVYLRANIRPVDITAAAMMQMIGLPVQSMASVQTLSWIPSREGWVRLVIGSKNRTIPGKKGIEGIAQRGRHLEKGRTPLAYEPQFKSKKTKSGRSAPRPSPLLAKLMRGM